jgi:hypothetical protein
MGKGAPKHKNTGGRKGGGSGSGGSVGVSKKSKRGANRGGGGKNANFAEVSVRQKNDSRLRQESKLRLLKVRALGRQVDKSEEVLRRFVVNNKKKVVKGYDPAMRGMELTGPARPAIDVELSDHGCGLRLFECRKQCVRDEDRPVEVDLFQKHQTGGKFADHPATLKHVQLLQRAGDACREAGHSDSAIGHFENGLALDTTDTFNIRPRMVALLMDTGDAARARQMSHAATPFDNVTYAWTLFLVEYISHFILKEEDSSEEVVMRSLESAMACNPHIGLFLSLSNVFEEVVDVSTLLQDIAGHHHHRRTDGKSNVATGANAVEVGSSGSSGSSGEQSKTWNGRSSSSNGEPDVIADEDVSDVTVALAYSIDQFGCWRDAGNEEGDDVRTYVYETAIHEHYEALDSKCVDISSVKLVRATYREFTLRLDAERSKNYDVVGVGDVGGDAARDGDEDAVFESVA